MRSNLPKFVPSACGHPGNCPPQKQSWGKKVSSLGVQTQAKTKRLGPCAVINVSGLGPVGGKGGGIRPMPLINFVFFFVVYVVVSAPRSVAKTIGFTTLPNIMLLKTMV